MLRQLHSLIVLLAVALLPNTSYAVLSESNWPIIHEAFFDNRTMTETDIIQVTAPLGAENAAQVPLSFSVSNIPTDAIKKIYVLIDANPIPMAATYLFPLHFKQLTLSTRVRLENDSMIRVIAETSSGKLLMAKTRVNAGGGCAGTVAEDETTVRASAGKMKLQLNPPYKPNETASLTLQIKHPMYTGLQTDGKTKQLKPAFFVKNIHVKHDQHTVMQMQLGVGTAENPYLKFSFDLPANQFAQPVQLIQIEAQDNEGKLFIQQLPVL